MPAYLPCYCQAHFWCHHDDVIFGVIIINDVISVSAGAEYVFWDSRIFHLEIFFVSIKCCIFWLAFGCWVHPKASWNTFFNIYCGFYKFFVDFSSKNKNKVWKSVFSYFLKLVDTRMTEKCIKSTKKVWTAPPPQKKKYFDQPSGVGSTRKPSVFLAVTITGSALDFYYRIPNFDIVPWARITLGINLSSLTSTW